MLNILNFFKSNWQSVVFTALGIFVICCLLFFNYKTSSLNNENNKLKIYIENKNKEIELLNNKIESLNKDILKLKLIIQEKEKQKEIEDSLLLEKQEKEKEINQCRDESYNHIETLKEENDEFKAWCEQPIPVDTSFIFKQLY